KPVAERLSTHLGKTAAFANDCVGPEAEAAANALKNGDVLLLENLRYHEGEENDDAAFASQLAKLGDVYVNDAFAAAHRADASVHGVAAKFNEKAAGLLLEKEVEYLSKALDKPDHPYVVVLGGAKVSDKIKVITRMLEVADTILIGGAMAYTFLLAQGKSAGKSLVEPDFVKTANDVLAKAASLKKQFLLPLDHVVAEKFEANAPHQTVGWDQIPAGSMALDI